MKTIINSSLNLYGRYPIPFNYGVNPLKRTKELGYESRYECSHDDIILIDNFITSIIGNSR